MAVSKPSFLRPVEHHVHVEGERCPWCEQPITHKKFKEIQAEIEAKERARSADHERQLKAELAKQRAEADAKAKANIERERKVAAAREVVVREEAKKAAEQALNTELAKAKQAKAAAEDQLKKQKAEHAAEANRRLLEQREVLDKAKATELSAERAKAFADRQKLESQLEDMKRKLQKKTAEELGEGAEVDIYETLRAEFDDDKIKRIDKGVAGVDIIHDVTHNGKICGRIVYDSKNRTTWRHTYVAKLREDQLAANADHAILPSRVFPSGAQQLHVQDGVIIINPARVAALVGLLRKHVIQTYSLRLSARDRDQKTVALYDFINSERCAQLFERAETLTDEMLDLEVKEKKAHDATWKRRGELIRLVQKAHGDITTEIDRIVAADGEDG